MPVAPVMKKSERAGKSAGRGDRVVFFVPVAFSFRLPAGYRVHGKDSFSSPEFRDYFTGAGFCGNEDRENE